MKRYFLITFTANTTNGNGSVTSNFRYFTENGKMFNALQLEKDIVDWQNKNRPNFPIVGITIMFYAEMSAEEFSEFNRE